MSAQLKFSTYGDYLRVLRRLSPTAIPLSRSEFYCSALFSGFIDVKSLPQKASTQGVRNSNAQPGMNDINISPRLQELESRKFSQNPGLEEA